MAIYKVDDGFVISSHSQWLPGIYADEATAHYAFQFDAVKLHELNDRICHIDRGNRVITMDDLLSAASAPIQKTTLDGLFEEGE